MAKKSGGMGNALWGLPKIVKILLAIFFEFIFGLARFIDGIIEGKIGKILIGFLWIFYGLFIGWIYDIICMIIDRRPWLL